MRTIDEQTDQPSARPPETYKPSRTAQRLTPEEHEKLHKYKAELAERLAADQATERREREKQRPMIACGDCCYLRDDLCGQRPSNEPPPKGAKQWRRVGRLWYPVAPGTGCREGVRRER